MKKCFLLSFLVLQSVCSALYAECTVYYTGPLTSPYAYAWSTGGEMSWPGKKMTATAFKYNGTAIIWSYTFASDFSYVIFSNNGSSQTSDLNCECGKLYVEDKDDWIEYSGTGDVLDTASTATVDTHGKVVPIESEDIMLQGFYWDSYQTDAPYGRTKWIDHLSDTAALAVFDLLWVPSPVQSSGGLGYHPTKWSSLDSEIGTRGKLIELINALHKRGVKVVADIVVNHRGNSNGWCTFYPDNFGSKYKSTSSANGYYQFTEEHIVSDDECFTDSRSSCKGSTTHGAKDSGVEAYAGARDLDHTNTYVRDAVKSYLAFLQGDAGFDGWRYDLVKSYAPKYLEEYNLASLPYISVCEYWDGNVNTLKSYLRKTNYHTMVFDFAMKYKAFNQGLQSNNYGNLTASAGSKLAREEGFGRYAVTFIDNHDTFKRGDSNEYCDGTGSGKSLTNSSNHDKVMEAYAYLLTMPGIPCVFYPHWKTFGTQIENLMAARRLVGVHSESNVSDEQSGNGFYCATVHGHRGSLIVRLGASRPTDTPTGYRLYTMGSKFSVYVKEESSALGNTESDRSETQKRLINGQLYLIRDGKTYTVTGQCVNGK